MLGITPLIGCPPLYCVVTSDAPYFVVQTKFNCDLVIDFMVISYFTLQMHHAKSFKMSFVKEIYVVDKNCQEMVLKWPFIGYEFSAFCFTKL